MKKNKKIEEAQVLTFEERFKNSLDLLKKSMDNEGISSVLTGKVSGIETVREMPVAVIRIDVFKIIIPAMEFMDIVVKEGNDPMQLYKYLMLKRLGSEIDFKIKAIDEKAKIAIASRKEAMKIVKEEKCFKKTNNNYDIKEGDKVDVRVLAAMQAGIIVDFYGKEVYIPPKELSYTRIYNAAEIFSPGQIVPAKITKLVRNEDAKDIEVSLSIKEVSENDIAEKMTQYSVGAIYTGEVSMIDGQNVFVKLDGNADVLCKYPSYGLNPIVGSTVAVRISLKNEEQKRIFGTIINVSLT